MLEFLVGFRSLVEEESTYWALVNSLNLQNELMDVHQSDISKILPYLFHAPPIVKVWHKAVFKVGPVARPKPNATGSYFNLFSYRVGTKTSTC